MYRISPVPSRLPEPPPAPMELTDADQVVGWIEGDRIGFIGFADANEAVNAAWVAYLTLARQLMERGEAEARAFRAGPPELGADGDAEVIFVRGRPIATLLRPDASRARGGDAYGFAVRVPPPADAMTVRSTAHLLYQALRTAGVRWAMWLEPAAHVRLVPAEAGEGGGERAPAAPAARSRLPDARERVQLAIVLTAALVVLAVEWLALWESPSAVVAATFAAATAVAVLVWRLRQALASVVGVAR